LVGFNDIWIISIINIIFATHIEYLENLFTYDMGLFNFYKKNENQLDIVSSKERNNGLFTEGKNSFEQIRYNPKTDVKGIEAIYAFLQADYESQGYNDALVSMNENYEADNIKQIMLELRILIQQVRTYYEDIIQELEFLIASRGRSSNNETLEEYKYQKAMIYEHITKVEEIRKEMYNKESFVQRIILSYQRGFKRGLSTLTQSDMVNKKENVWIRVGCFLTGYNYDIIRNSSEASTKTVKKYLSALIIIGIIWGIIGYAFTQRYLHGSVLFSTIGALIMVVLIVQVERQLILSIGKNHLIIIFRMIIGLIIAIIGSIILDQIMFKADVEKAQISKIQQEISELLPPRTFELTQIINQLDKSIQTKEKERTTLLEEITKTPIIRIPTSTTESKKDSMGKITQSNHTNVTQSIPNPKIETLSMITEQIKNLQDQKIKREDEKLKSHQILEQELSSKIGFWDELNVLFSILLSSPLAFMVWILIFFFFFAIELFVLLNKYGNKNNDYDQAILHQMEIRIKMLEKLNES
jgi:hypothetical protein